MYDIIMCILVRRYDVVQPADGFPQKAVSRGGDERKSIHTINMYVNGYSRRE